MNSVIPEDFICFELVVNSQSYSSPVWYSIEAVVNQPASLEFGVVKSSCIVPWFS